MQPTIGSQFNNQKARNEPAKAIIVNTIFFLRIIKGIVYRSSRNSFSRRNIKNEELFVVSHRRRIGFCKTRNKLTGDNGTVN